MPITLKARVQLIESVIPLAHSIARREAHREDDVDDLVQVGLFALHRALKKEPSVQNAPAFAGTIFVRAMRGYYWRTREWQGRGQPDQHVELDVLSMPFDGPVAPVSPDFFLSDYLTALEAVLGIQARLMVENLMDPSGDCARNILAEVHAKQSVRKGRTGAHLPRGVTKRIRLTPRMVRDALAIAPTAWTARMQEIRDFTKLWLALEED